MPCKIIVFGSHRKPRWSPNQVQDAIGNDVWKKTQVIQAGREALGGIGSLRHARPQSAASAVPPQNANSGRIIDTVLKSELPQSRVPLYLGNW